MPKGKMGITKKSYKPMGKKKKVKK